MWFSLFNLFASVAKGCGGSFFGLEPWYQYLNVAKVGNPPQCEIQNFTIFSSHSDILLVLAAIVDDLLRIAGIVAVIFVIIGAIKFIASQGNSEDATNARNNIIDSLVGLAIAMIGVGLVNFIGTQLGK